DGLADPRQQRLQPGPYRLDALAHACPPPQTISLTAGPGLPPRVGPVTARDHEHGHACPEPTADLFRKTRESLATVPAPPPDRTGPSGALRRGVVAGVLLAGQALDLLHELIGVRPLRGDVLPPALRRQGLPEPNRHPLARGGEPLPDRLH